jgi:hypothetical protein
VPVAAGVGWCAPFARIWRFWRPVWNPWLLYWLLIAGTVVGTSLPRLSYGTWAWRAGSSSAFVYGGVAIEWEWVDVAQSAWFAEGDPRWEGRLSTSLKGQNVVRFVPGLAVSWLGVWTREAWRAAVLLTWACWLSAAAATYGLCRLLLPDVARGRRVGAIAAALVALGPGFSAFVGDVDAHPFGYAAAPLALLALERAWAGPAGGRAGDRLGAPWLLGGVIFLANGSLELGPPLLAMVWILYVVSDSGLSAGRLRERARWAAGVSATYIGLQAGWWAIANVAALGTVQGYNEGLPLILESWRALGRGLPDRQVVTGIGFLTADGLVREFTPPVAWLFLPGLAVLPRRSALWAILWVALVVAASLATRNFGRVHYLAHPAVYVASAAAAERLGELLAGLILWSASRSPRPGQAHQGIPGRLARVTRRGRVRIASAVRWAVPALLLYAVGRTVLADLAGDLTMVHQWWW